MKKRGIKANMIPSFFPQLNPAEQLIGLIKLKIKKSWLNHKSLSLKLVQKIVEEINYEAWRKWILSSKIESIFKMDAFKNNKSNI